MFNIVEVVTQVVKEVNEAKAAGLPVELPTHVRFDALVVDDDENHWGVNVEFDVPLMRYSMVNKQLVDWSYGYQTS